MSDVSLFRACESDTRNLPGGGNEPIFVIYDSQRMSTTGVPHTRALSYFAPAAAGHNKWVVRRLNVGACVIPSRVRLSERCAKMEEKEKSLPNARARRPTHMSSARLSPDGLRVISGR